MMIFRKSRDENRGPADSQDSSTRKQLLYKCLAILAFLAVCIPANIVAGIYWIEIQNKNPFKTQPQLNIARNEYDHLIEQNDQDVVGRQFPSNTTDQVECFYIIPILKYVSEFNSNELFVSKLLYQLLPHF